MAARTATTKPATKAPAKTAATPKTDVAGRRVKKAGEPAKALYAEKAIPTVIAGFADWLTAQTGYEVDPRSVYLGSALRGDFQQSPENQKRLADRAAEIEQEKADREQRAIDRAAAKVEREAAKAAKAAEPKAEKAAPAKSAAKTSAKTATAKAAPAKRTPAKAAAKTDAKSTATPTRRRPARPAKETNADF